MTPPASDDATVETADEPASIAPMAKGDNPRRVGLRDTLTAGAVRAQGEVRSAGATTKTDGNEAGPKARDERGVVREALNSTLRAFGDGKKHAELAQQKPDQGADTAAAGGDSGSEQD